MRQAKFTLSARSTQLLNEPTGRRQSSHRVSAPTVHHSPIYPAHGFSSADSYISQNSISSSSRSDHRSKHSTDFPFAKKDDQIRVCVINFGSLISHDKTLATLSIHRNVRS